MPLKRKTTIEFAELPILPVRDTVLFPNAILPLTVGRESSLKLVNELKEEEKFIGVIAQRDPRVDNPQPVDLFQIGTVAFVHKIIKLPSQSLFIFVEGLQRIASGEVIQHGALPARPRQAASGHRAGGKAVRFRGPGAQRDHAVPAGGSALAHAFRRPADRGHEYRRSAPPDRLHCRQPARRSPRPRNRSSWRVST